MAWQNVVEIVNAQRHAWLIDRFWLTAGHPPNAYDRHHNLLWHD